MTFRTLARTAGLALIFAAMVPVAARSASEDGRFAVKGVGVQTCKEFTEEFKERSSRYLLFGGWLDGYISAVNRMKKGTFDATPWQSTDVMLALVNNHCSQRPDERFFAVVTAMLQFFEDQQLTVDSEKVETAAGENKLTVYRTVLRRAQEALAEEGAYSGAADGLYGPKTRTAFETFQEKRGLPKTGLPDQQTLFVLFAQPKAAQPSQ